MAESILKRKAESALRYSHQAEKLSLDPTNDGASDTSSGSTAVHAKFITPLDPVIETADGNRLPAVPLDEAAKLNQLKNETEGHENSTTWLNRQSTESRLGAGDAQPVQRHGSGSDSREELSHVGTDAKLVSAIPPSRTHPLFPPLPLYGPASTIRNLQCKAFRLSSCVLSLAFLGVIVLGSVFTSIPLMFRHIGLLLTFRNPDARRPFYQEEKRRKAARRQAEREWSRQNKRRHSQSEQGRNELGTTKEDYQPTEGGPDPLICDVGYYARRVGLNVEEFKVQTEDGFIITMWHVYNPAEYAPCEPEARAYKSPDVFIDEERKAHSYQRKQYTDGSRRYPVLLMHGLLQSAGAYCTNDDDSLAFSFAKLAMTFGWGTTAVDSILATPRSTITIPECGLGTSDRWGSWTFPL